jgi:UDP-N-acetyl-D-mannosaminuronate dehydrogenase
MQKIVKIAIAGTGYVGLSNAILLAQHNEVVALAVLAAKVDIINQKQSSNADFESAGYFTLNLLIYETRWTNETHMLKPHLSFTSDKIFECNLPCY